jgi:hypothetical protein
MKWVRVADGMLCFAISVFFGVAVFQNFFLSAVAVTDVVYPDYSSIIKGTTAAVPVTPEVCSMSLDASVSGPCQCLVSAGTDTEKAYLCIQSHNGLPSTQVVVGHMNPNFFLFYVFMVAAMYQLVLRNAMGIDLSFMNRDVQFGVVFMCIVIVISCVLSIFQFDHGFDMYVLINFMPQQLILMILSFVLYSNAHFADVPKEFRDKYIHALFAGVLTIATIPMMAVFVCCINAWTTTRILHFMYNTTMLLSIVQLAYHCVFIDSKQIATNTAAKVRMRQAMYLMLLTILTCLTVVTFVYIPVHEDVLHRFTAISFIVLLWTGHLVFDATKASVDDYLYERIFNLFDAAVAVVRYLLLIFSLYLVWGTAV